MTDEIIALDESIILDNEICSFNEDFSFKQFNIEIVDGTEIDMNPWFYDVWNQPNSLNLVKPVKQLKSFYEALQQKAKQLNCNLFENTETKHYVISHKTCEQYKYDLMSDEQKAEYDYKKKVNQLRSERMTNKGILTSTDWVVSKMNEYSITGEMTVDELKAKYATELKQRADARARINEIESELTELGEDFEFHFDQDM